MATEKPRPAFWRVPENAKGGRSTQKKVEHKGNRRAHIEEGIQGEHSHLSYLLDVAASKNNLVWEGRKVVVWIGGHKLVVQVAQSRVPDPSDLDPSGPHQLDGVDVVLLCVVFSLKVKDIDF